MNGPCKKVDYPQGGFALLQAIRKANTLADDPSPIALRPHAASPGRVRSKCSLRTSTSRSNDTVVPVADDPTLELRPMLDFQAGYVQRSVDMFPRQGSHGPWTVAMSYADDRARLRKGPVEDSGLRFSRSTPALVVAA